MRRLVSWCVLGVLVAWIVGAGGRLGTEPASRAKAASIPMDSVLSSPEIVPPRIRIEAPAGDTTLAVLAKDLQKIAAKAGGSVGFAMLHLESGARISIRGNERFPMASVFKIPIALAILHAVACDELSLEDSVAITPADLRTGSGWIWAHRRRVHRLPLGELFEAMLVDSDNTASDILMRLCGGPEEVTAQLRALGIEGVRVDRYEAAMALDYAGVDTVPPESTWTVDALWRLKKEVPLDRRAESAAAFLDDPRDTATPDAMVDLLARVWCGEALGPDETSRLLEILERVRTGPNRIPGLLPEGTPVAHKTGTWSTSFGITAAVNDVGIVSLPDGRHIALAIFVKGTNRGWRRAERAIAALSRASYDYWVRDTASQTP